jgi:hypothetical protein
MMFRKKRKAAVEILSVHIPKCAGTSFTAILQSRYGPSLFLDYQGTGGQRIPETVSAIHGHFPMARYSGVYPHAFKMTWIRHPVERIISYYYYWKASPPHGNPWHDEFIRLQPSLLEFAGYEAMKTEISRGYFGNFDWRKLDFVGLVENVDADIVRLSRRLGWSEIPFVIHSNSGTSKMEVPRDTCLELESVLSDEMRIYCYWKDRSAS